jgi:hypothetical protein
LKHKVTLSKDDHGENIEGSSSAMQFDNNENSTTTPVADFFFLDNGFTEKQGCQRCDCTKELKELRYILS